MMSDFRGGGGSKKVRLYKVKIGVRGGGGVKNESKKSDIIYERSLIEHLKFASLAKNIAKFSSTLSVEC